MSIYEPEQLYAVAKRINNPRRNFFLLGPLQAKCIPVSPTAALNMMDTLGQKVRDKCPTARLVIGFAETGTAIGAAVANAISPDCIYVHTTREELPANAEKIEFLEEHSHAREQTLCVDYLQNSLDCTDTVVFVDDEISTGKTLINVVTQMKKRFPALAEKRLVAVSVINRVSPENEALMLQHGIECEWLAKIPEDDYEQYFAGCDCVEAEFAPEAANHAYNSGIRCGIPCSLRFSNVISNYVEACMEASKFALPLIADDVGAKALEHARILILGTEECMYPSLLFGAYLESTYPGATVKCHSTTRSPVGICSNEGYPITSGSKVRSIYDQDRITYVYNQENYDIAIIVSDKWDPGVGPLSDIANAFPGCEKWFYIGSR